MNMLSLFTLGQTIRYGYDLIYINDSEFHDDDKKKKNTHNLRYKSLPHSHPDVFIANSFK